ncbi:SDR family NAD(P)-dependent oxidoreductase [Desulfobotulus sp. H1]|uniref:SDR family NAD(P)-dependent oxidoreductase n=1 Tax=Desulfobotulus pelophilus TaxID=2823377 RepID=A0ABT3N7D9_9BACT|nr:NAD-dependent epimerase/dehydratase family protein [Desulfobotulus pelophilus]MCW7753365.1 SDR family NAD(P)-dependent oxidoreductase [Desulfobotulus pelophilus]
MKKILVTGASGFIGSQLCTALLKMGCEVRILSRSHSPARQQTAPRCEVYPGDITRPESLKGVAKNVSHVFHLASRVTDWGSYNDFYETAVEGTRHILEACMEEKVERFVYFSSCAALGFCRPTRGLDEEAPAIRTGIPYSDTKLDAEILVRQVSHSSGIPVTIIRPANVIGPESLWTRDVLQAFQKGPVPLIAGGRAPGAFISVDNLVEGSLLAAFSPRAAGRTYHFMDGDSPDWRTYIQTLAGWIGKSTTASLPVGLAWKLGGAAEWLSGLTGKRPPISRISAAIMGMDHSVSTQRAKEELGWQSRVSYNESMEKIRSHLTAHNKLPGTQ